MGYLAVGEQNAHAVGVVHMRDIGKTQRRCKELRQIFLNRFRIGIGRRESVHDLQSRCPRELLQQGGAAEALGQTGKQIDQREPILLSGEKHAQDRQTRVPGQQRF